jgi:hypothetical protein
VLEDLASRRCIAWRLSWPKANLVTEVWAPYYLDCAQMQAVFLESLAHCRIHD